MAADLPVRDPPPAGADRVCVNCGKAVDRDRKRLCNHCGLPFRTGSDSGPAPEGSRPGVPQLCKALATLAVVLPPLGPVSSLASDAGTLLGFWIVAIASAAAVAFAWWRPLPGGILVALVGTIPFIVELVQDATGATAPSSRYWLLWFLPGGLVGGALFLAAAFWRASGPAEPGAARAGAGGPGQASLVERARREAVGLAALVVVGLAFVAVVASYPEGMGSGEPLPAAIVIAGFPLLLAGAGVLGYREDRARGSFVAGLVGAVVAMASLGVALAIAGRALLQVGEGEWIGEAWLAVGLAIVAGGFFGLIGGGIAELIRGLSWLHAPR